MNPSVRVVRIGIILSVVAAAMADAGSGSGISGTFPLDTRTVSQSTGVSGAFSVDTREAVLAVSIVVTAPVGQWTVGNPIGLAADVSGSTGAVSYTWAVTLFNQLDNPHSPTPWATFAVEGLHRVDLSVQDAVGTVSAYLYVPIGKSPVLGEPGVRPAADPFGAKVLGVNGSAFTFDEAKIPNGFMMIIHGIWTDAEKTDWMMKMGQDVRARLPDPDEPNICVLDWEPFANPSSTIADIFLPSGIAKLYRNYAFDLLAIQPSGVGQGLSVAKWIRNEINAGHISTDAPIHLVAHSAGAFVAGEVGFHLRNEITQITLLDTPFLQGYQWLGVVVPTSPVPLYIPGYLNPGKAERYISSRYGMLQLDFIDPVFSSSYHREMIWPPHCFWNQLAGWAFEDHYQAYKWYGGTIQDPTATNGFYYSPFLGNGFHDDASHAMDWDEAVSRARESTASGRTNIVLQGFAHFGQVQEADGVYTITEEANAGIFKTVEFPVQARSVGFMYRFLSGSDEDFLSVHVGSNTVVYVGANTPLTRAADTYGEGIVRFFGGATETLTFKLVSRGEADAQLLIHSISLTYAFDSDGDGLGDDDETNTGVYVSPFDTGTDPYRPDTDRDGAWDGDEIVAGTDPNSPLDVFMAAALHSDGGFAGVAWLAKAGLSYRVLRSFDLETWDPAPDGDAEDEQSERTALVDGVLEFYDPESIGYPKVFYVVAVME